jgi:DNA-binding transcriptional ArsR family regulator
MQGLLTPWGMPPILHLVVKYELDRVAHAIASEPRRALIECLAEGETSMSGLATHLDLSLPAVDKHVHVLLDAGVVSKSKSGRTTSVRLVPGSLDGLATWAMSTRLMWDHALDRLEQHLAAPSDSEETS